MIQLYLDNILIKWLPTLTGLAFFADLYKDSVQWIKGIKIDHSWLIICMYIYRHNYAYGCIYILMYITTL